MHTQFQEVQDPEPDQQRNETNSLINSTASSIMTIPEADILTPNIIEVFTAYFDAGDDKFNAQPPAFIAQLVKVDVQDDSLRCVTLKDGQGQLFSALIRDSTIDSQPEETVKLIHCAQYRLTQDEKKQFQVYLFEFDTIKRLENAETFPDDTLKLINYWLSLKTEWMTVTCTEWQIKSSVIFFKITDAGLSMQCTVFKPVTDELLKYQKEGLVLSIKNPTCTPIPDRFRGIAGVDDEVKLNQHSNFRVINPEDNSILFEHSCLAEQQDDRVPADAVKIAEPPPLQIEREYLKIVALTKTFKHDWIRATTEGYKLRDNCIRLYLRDDSGCLPCTIFPPILEEIRPHLTNGLIVELKNSLVKELPEQYRTEGSTVEIKINQYAAIKLINPSGEILYEHSPVEVKPISSENKPDPCPAKQQDDKVSADGVEIAEPPPLQIEREYLKIAALTKTFKHDWIRATTEGFKLRDNCIRLYLRDDSGCLPCTIFPPILEEIRPHITNGLIVELKNSLVKELPEQYRTEQSTVEIKINQYAAIKLINSSGEILYQHSLDEVKPKISSNIRVVDTEDGSILSENKSADPCPTEQQDDKVKADVVEIAEPPPPQIEREYLKIAALTKTFKHDWIRATTEGFKLRDNCIRLYLRDDSGCLPCTIFPPILEEIRPHLTNGLIVELKNSLVKELPVQYRTEQNTLEIKINHYAVIKLINPSGEILYEHSPVEVKPISSENKPVDPCPAEQEVDKVTADVVEIAEPLPPQIEREYLKIAALTKTFKHDWIRTTIEGNRTHKKCISMWLRDESGCLPCTIFPPIFEKIQHVLTHGLIVELKNSAVKELYGTFRTDHSKVEIKVNKYTAIKLFDRTGKQILYEYSPDGESVANKSETTLETKCLTLPEHPATPDCRFSDIKMNEPPEQVDQQSKDFSSLIPTNRGWIRAKVEDLRIGDDRHHLRLKNQSISIVCTILSPIWEEIKPLLKNELEIEFKNPRVQQSKIGSSDEKFALEIILHAGTTVKLRDLQDYILYEYPGEYGAAAEKSEAPTLDVESQTKLISDSSNTEQVNNYPDCNMNDSWPLVNPAARNSKQVSSIAVKPGMQIERRFIEMSSLIATNTHDWIQATVVKEKLLKTCIYIWLRDKSITMQCMIVDPIFTQIMSCRPLLVGSMVNIRNSLVQPRQTDDPTNDSRLWITLNWHASLEVVDTSGKILFKYSVETESAIISEPIQQLERVLQKKRPAETPVEQPVVKKIYKENQSFTKLCNLKNNSKHDWVQVTVESPWKGRKSAILTVYDDTSRMRCEIFDPIFPSVCEFIKDGTIVELKNTKVQKLDETYQQMGLSILELKVGNDSLINVLDVEGNVVFSYPPSHASPIITSIAKTDTRDATVVVRNVNVTKTTPVRPQIQKQQKSQQSRRSEASLITSIRDVQSCKKDSFIDIAGYVVCGQLELRRKSPFKQITLEDDTGCVNMSLWGQMAREFSHSRVHFLFKNVKVNEYNDKKELVYHANSSSFVRTGIR